MPEVKAAVAEPKVTVLKNDPNIKPPDEKDKRPGVCPWCNYENEDEEKGPVHKKEYNLVRNAGTKHQCDTCGKIWEKSSLDKPWSIALERGPLWVREQQARRLSEM